MRSQIIASLEPMILEAEQKGLMIQCTGMHNEVRMTSEKFRECLSNGRFIWGPVNWRLEEPTEYESNQMLLDELQ